MGLFNTLRFIINHPLNVHHKTASISRFISWQIGSRLIMGPVAVNFVNNSRLLVSPGMKGATGNIYAGLDEFENMSFVLHFLRKGDVFVDVGANVGAYTVLAGAVVGAKCVSIEPIPDTFKRLLDNINLNEIYKNSHCLNIGIGRETRTLKFTSTLDSINHVVTDEDKCVETIDVPVRALDDVAGNMRPLLIKIDVEGFETEVIAGANNVLSEHSLLAIIMEMDGSGERYGFNEFALHGRMLDFGFKSFSYSPFKRELIPLEGKNSKSRNTLYIRDIEQVAERVKLACRFVVNGSEV